MRITRRVVPNEVFCTVMPHSEVCVHMQVAGRYMYGKLAANGRSVQLLEPRGPLQTLCEFSAPILPGEAGLYSDSDGLYFNSEVSIAEYVDMFASDCT